MATIPLTARASCVAIDSASPDWIELIPSGPHIIGADGRSWVNDAQDKIISAFNSRAHPMVIDWEHATEHRAPQGLDAPAAGWVDRLEVRGGAIWGHAEWTEKAAAQIAQREYRYLSPVFLYEKQSRRISALTSAALTNTPNLTLTALNCEESPMPLPTALCRALNIPDDASEADAITAAQAVQKRLATAKSELATALNRAETPPLEKFVPRGDYDAALTRATNAEQQIKTLQDGARKDKVDALIEKALTAGQIVPATKDYYVAMCQSEAGVAAFEAFLAKAPAIVGGESKLDAKKPPGNGVGSLTDAQKAICQSMGISTEDYLKQLQKEAA